MEFKIHGEWKDIKGYEGTYQVSDKGDVCYFTKGDNEMKLKSQKINKDGYCYVVLRKKRKLVHRLVAEAFIDNLKNKETVNHIYRYKKCNCIENLEWMTQEENNQAYEASRKKVNKF